MNHLARNFFPEVQEAPEKVVVGERLSGTTFMKDFFTGAAT